MDEDANTELHDRTGEWPALTAAAQWPADGLMIRELPKVASLAGLLEGSPALIIYGLFLVLRFGVFSERVYEVLVFCLAFFAAHQCYVYLRGQRYPGLFVTAEGVQYGRKQAINWSDIKRLELTPLWPGVTRIGVRKLHSRWPIVRFVQSPVDELTERLREAQSSCPLMNTDREAWLGEWAFLKTRIALLIIAIAISAVLFAAWRASAT